MRLLGRVSLHLMHQFVFKLKLANTPAEILDWYIIFYRTHQITSMQLHSVK